MWLFNRKKKGSRIKGPTAREKMRFADKDDTSSEMSEYERELQKSLWEALDKFSDEELKDFKKRKG